MPFFPFPLALFCLYPFPPAQHSSFIGRAKLKNKGRISRYLANKCSIASRVDCFSDNATDVFGRMLRDQVDERLKFYDTGAAPRKNMDVMAAAIAEAEAVADAAPAAMDDGSDGDSDAEEPATPASKKDKSSKKGKSSSKKEKEVKTPKSSKKEKKRSREEEGGKEKSAKKSSSKKSKRAAAVEA